MGWHADDEKLYGPTPEIASVSFGCEREFLLKKRPPKGSKGINYHLCCSLFSFQSIECICLLVLMGICSDKFSYSLSEICFIMLHVYVCVWILLYTWLRLLRNYEL